MLEPKTVAVPPTRATSILILYYTMSNLITAPVFSIFADMGRRPEENYTQRKGQQRVSDDMSEKAVSVTPHTTKLLVCVHVCECLLMCVFVYVCVCEPHAGVFC